LQKGILRRLSSDLVRESALHLLQIAGGIAKRVNRELSAAVKQVYTRKSS